MHFYPPDIIKIFFAKKIFFKYQKKYTFNISIFFFAKKKTLRKLCDFI
jgi:hypothetical protein